MKKIYTLLGFLTIFSSASLAQTDTTAVEEDYSAYENMTVQG